MRNTGLLCVLLLLSAAMAYAQGEVAPSTDSGPLKVRPELPQSDQPLRPKPDSEGVYSIGPGISLPVLLHAVPAADSDDVPDCEPRVVVVAAVIGVDGRASVREFFTPRSSPCANPAILAIKQSQFQPAKWNHLAIPVRTCLSVPFAPDQRAIPSLVPCPASRDLDRQEETDFVPTKAKPTMHGQEVVLPTTGPTDADTVTPIPDEDGVYSLGPGIASPVLKTTVEAAPANAVAACQHPTIASAVINVDGTIKVGGVYGIYVPDDKACDHLAIAAIEQSRARPATLNGVAVPVRVCLGVPFGRPAPPVPKPLRCPRDVGATPLGDPDAFLPRPGMKLPVVISAPPAPEYSREARKKKIQGAVTISLLVTEEGLPADARVVKGLGYGLDEIALDTARQYRFRPATLDGKPVPVRTSIEVDFDLQKN